MSYWPGTNTPKSRNNAFDLSLAGSIAEQIAKEQKRIDNGKEWARRTAAQAIQIDPNPAASRAKTARLCKAQI